MYLSCIMNIKQMWCIAFQNYYKRVQHHVFCSLQLKKWNLTTRFNDAKIRVTYFVNSTNVTNQLFSPLEEWHQGRNNMHSPLSFLNVRLWKKSMGKSNAFVETYLSINSKNARSPRNIDFFFLEVQVRKYDNMNISQFYLLVLVRWHSQSLDLPVTCLFKVYLIPSIMRDLSSIYAADTFTNTICRY